MWLQTQSEKLKSWVRKLDENFPQKKYKKNTKKTKKTIEEKIKNEKWYFGDKNITKTKKKKDAKSSPSPVPLSPAFSPSHCRTECSSRCASAAFSFLWE